MTKRVNLLLFLMMPMDLSVLFMLIKKKKCWHFFEKHGVVVVSNVLTEQECQRSVDDV
jgi:hypothetical protein